MDLLDDDLVRFETDGAHPLPVADDEGYVEREGARIWYATFGSGTPVTLLHGGFGSGENWGYQVPALVATGHRAILIDSRAHGRSTRGTGPLGYVVMAADVLAVLDALGVRSTAIVGWSDGATTALILGMTRPERVTRLFAFAGSMHIDGVKQLESQNPVVDRMFGRLMLEYARRSPTPDAVDSFTAEVGTMMATEPTYTADDLATISVPVAIVDGDDDEFIKQEHLEHLTGSIPAAQLIILPGVTHFAPLQRPELFNRAMISYLDAR